MCELAADDAPADILLFKSAGGGGWVGLRQAWAGGRAPWNIGGGAFKSGQLNKAGAIKQGASRFKRQQIHNTNEQSGLCFAPWFKRLPGSAVAYEI